MTEEYGRLKVAMIPSLPEQEAEAESQRLAGAATSPEPQQSTSYADPLDTTPHKRVDLQGGDSHQVPWQPPSHEGASAVSEQHYYIHRVTETIDRGYYGFDSVAWNMKEGVAVQLLGLNDDRPRAELLVLAIDSDTIIYIGDRDVIDGAAPQTTGIWVADVESTYTYRARKELWAVAVGGSATMGVTSYKSEPNSDSLATQSSSGAGAR